jgi:hypothetical protein
VRVHNQDCWEDFKEYFDYRIFMDADIDICIEGYTPDEIDIRCEKVDRVNAWTVFRSKHRADVVVTSSAVSTTT